MKTNFTLFVILFGLTFGILHAQDRIFTITATEDNINNAGFLVLDHPLLNNNPYAKIIATHHWTSVWNNNHTIVHYNYVDNRWVIRNGDLIPVVLNSSYNVYIGEGDEMISITNFTLNTHRIELDDPRVNNNPDAKIVIQCTEEFISPGTVDSYGVQYEDGIWYILNIANDDIPSGSRFFVLIEDNETQSFRHITDDDNMTGYSTYIDHPSTNNNPDAILFVSQYKDGENAFSNTASPIGVFYSQAQNKWIIFKEDQGIFSNIWIGFTVYVHDGSMNTQEVKNTSFTAYPNPFKDVLTIQYEKPVEKVEIYDLTGKTLLKSRPNSSDFQLNTSQLPSGVYVVKIESNSKVISKKIIKK